MWLFLSRRLRMWLILTVLVPLATGLLRRVGRHAGAAERTRPAVSRALLRAGDLGDRPRATPRRHACIRTAPAARRPGLTRRTRQRAENRCMTHPTVTAAWRATPPGARSAASPCSATAGRRRASRRRATRRCRWSGCAPSSSSSARARPTGGSAPPCSATAWPAGTAPRPTPTPTSAGPSSSCAPSTAPTCPIVLVGHSMGGRAALRAGGDPQVAAVCGARPLDAAG